jgi:hypothetical protein
VTGGKRSNTVCPSIVNARRLVDKDLHAVYLALLHKIGLYVGTGVSMVVRAYYGWPVPWKGKI